MSIKKRKIGRRTTKNDFEYDSYKSTKTRLPKGAKVEYEVDTLPYTISHNYTPDLTITFKDGTILYIELKGLGRSFDAHARQKMVAVKAQHPEKDIRIIFSRDGRLMGMKMTASQWAEKYGFKYSIKEIPEEWLNNED